MTASPASPPTSLQEWCTAAGIDAPPLQQRTRCGVPIQALYTGADLQQRHGNGYRSPYPAPQAAARRPWQAGQRHDHPDLAAAAAMIAEDIANDVDLLLLEWPQAARQVSISAPADEHQGGLAIASAHDFQHLFPAGQPLPMLALDAGACALPAAALLLAFANQRGDGANLHACLGIDPLGALASGARLSLSAHLAAMTAAALHVAEHHPGVKALGVSTSAYHLAGASDVQELAFAAATTVAYLEALLAAGMDADGACAQLVITLQADTDFFPQIAKFRAARILCHRIASAFGAGLPHVRLHAESALRFLSRCDPHVNIVRIATAGCAATIAGVDALFLHPFTRALGVAETDARRIARNTHFLLSEEAMPSAIADAAAGSWSIDSLTRDMAEAAWSLFQDISRHGGMAEYLRSGRAGELLQQHRAWRNQQIATAAARIVGVNVHPCPDEDTPPTYDIAPQSRHLADERILAGLHNPPAAAPQFADLLQQAADGAGLGELAATLAADADAAVALPQSRDSQPWEELRRKGAAFAQQTGSPPAVFLVCGEADDTPRQWIADVKDLLACAGMNIAGETSLSRPPDDIAADFANSGALLTLVLQQEPTPTAAAAAQACLNAGAQLTALWRPGAPAATPNDAPPFAILLDSASDLPEAFSRIHDRLRQPEIQP